MAEIKKFLDSDGLTYFCKKFKDYPDNEILGTVINAIDNVKVDKVEGKDLSTNDYTNEDKGKLNSSITFNEQILTESQQAQARTNIGDADKQDVEQLISNVHALDRDVNGYIDGIPAKYFRISFNRVWNANTNTLHPSAAVAELRFYGADGEELPIESVTADSEYSAAYSAAKVLDGDLATFWSSKDAAGVVHTLECVLVEAGVAVRIGIVPRKDVDIGRLDELTVEASADGAVWTQVLHIENEKDSWESMTWRYFDLIPTQVSAPSMQTQIDACRADVDGVKYIHAELAGAWDYVGLPATDAPKQVIFAEDAKNPMKDFPNYVLSGRNYHPTENRFSRNMPHYGITYDLNGHLMHITGRVDGAEISSINQLTENADEIYIPLPEDIQPGDALAFRIFAIGNYGYLRCDLNLFNAEKTYLDRAYGEFPIGKDTIKIVTVPEGAAFFSLYYAVKNGTDGGNQEMYAAVAIYKASSNVSDSGIADAPATEVSVFPTPALQLAFDAKVRDYVDMRVDELASMESTEALGADDLGYLTPEMYGAVGDYYADDTDAIQQCVNAAFGQWPPLKVKMLRKYLTTRPIELYCNYMDVEINWLKYTGDDVAIRICGKSPSVVITKLDATNGRGIEFTNVWTAHGVHGGYLRANEIYSSGDCLTAYTGGILYNIAYCTFVLPRLGSVNGCLINCEDGFVNCSFSGGYTNAPNDYGIRLGANTNIFRDFSFENCKNILHGVARLEHCRTAECLDKYDGTGDIGMLAVFDAQNVFGDTDECRITDRNMFVYWDCVSVSDNLAFDAFLEAVNAAYEADMAAGVEYNPGNYGYDIKHYDPVVFERVCAYAPWNIDPYARGYMPSGKMIVNFNEKLFVPDDPYHKIVNEAEYAPFEQDVFCPDTFETGCNCVIRLHASYCCIGVKHFRLIQRDGYKATVYDKHGKILFDGTQQGDGVYNFDCALRPLTEADYNEKLTLPDTWPGYVMSLLNRHYNGKNDVWTITKLAAVKVGGETPKTLTAGNIDNMNVSTFENKLVSEVEA